MKLPLEATLMIRERPHVNLGCTPFRVSSARGQCDLGVETARMPSKQQLVEIQRQRVAARSHKIRDSNSRWRPETKPPTALF
jgi:hypothetical protein